MDRKLRQIKVVFVFDLFGFNPSVRDLMSNIEHPLKVRPGRGIFSRKDQGVWLAYFDSKRRAAHAHIYEISQWVAKFEIRTLWNWKFRPESDTLSAIMSIFSPLWAIEHFLRARTKTPNYCIMKLFRRYLVPPSPYDSLNVKIRKIGKFLFFKPT